MADQDQVEEVHRCLQDNSGNTRDGPDRMFIEKHKREYQDGLTRLVHVHQIGVNTRVGPKECLP